MATNPDNQSSDLIKDILERVVLAYPAIKITDLQFIELEKNVRKEWNGDRDFISRHVFNERNANIRRDHERRERVDFLCIRYKLTRRRIFQILYE